MSELFRYLAGCCAFIAATPLLLLLALLRLASAGFPVFTCQFRTGLNGKRFRIYKLATAVPTRACHPCLTPVVAIFEKTCRKTSADDLAQLWNVVLGDMTLVGPRPHPENLDAKYIRMFPDLPRRYQVRPGITGLAQMNGARGEVQTASDMAKRLQLDFKYIKARSLRLDFQLLAQTLAGGFIDGNCEIKSDR